MPSYRDILKRVKDEIDEVDASAVQNLNGGVLVDADIVDETNLQRQIVHSLDRLGTPKVDSAKRTIEALNADVNVVTYRERLTSENVDRILGDGWDLIVDGADN